MAYKTITLASTDPAFYPLLGPYLGSRAVAAHVGDKIWDDPGKTWIVITHQEQVAGFIALRPGRGLVHVESCYADPGHPAIARQLVAAAVKAAEPSAMSTTVRHEHAETYLDAGFAEVGRTVNFTKLARGGAK